MLHILHYVDATDPLVNLNDLDRVPSLFVDWDTSTNVLEACDGLEFVLDDHEPGMATAYFDNPQLKDDGWTHGRRIRVISLLPYDPNES